MKTEKIKNKDNKNEFATKSSDKKPKDLQANKLKSKNSKKKLGMGLSSLLSKDQELASIIKSKVEQEVKSSTFKIQQPKLSNKETHRKSILNLKSKEFNTLLKFSWYIILYRELLSIFILLSPLKL